MLVGVVHDNHNAANTNTNVNVRSTKLPIDFTLNNLLLCSLPLSFPCRIVTIRMNVVAIAIAMDVILSIFWVGVPEAVRARVRAVWIHVGMVVMHVWMLGMGMVLILMHG